MRKNFFLLILIYLPLNILAQTVSGEISELEKNIKKFKEDSALNAQKLLLSGQELEKLKVEQEKLKTLTKLFGDTSLKSVNSNISITQDGVAMPETKALFFYSLKEYFSKLDIKIPKKNDSETGPVNIILNFSSFPMIPQYYIFANKLKNLKEKFDQTVNKKENVFGAGAALAGAIGIARAASELLAVLKTEAEFKLNDEKISEEEIAGFIMKSKKLTGYSIYTPEIVPIGVGSFGEKSQLLQLISEIETSEHDAKEKIEAEINNADENLKKTTEESEKEIANREKELTAAKEKLKKEPNNTQLKGEIENIEKKITDLKTAISRAKAYVDGVTAEKGALKELSDDFTHAKKYLNQAVKDDSLTSAGAKLLLIEQVIEKLKSTHTYILKIKVSGKGTNKITRHFLGITMKHSSSTTFNYLLYNNDGALIDGDTDINYTKLLKSKKIKELIDTKQK